MNFLVDFNNKLVKRMVFYKDFSNESFNNKSFSSNKCVINNILLEGSIKKRVLVNKKDILKKNIILRLLTNNSLACISNKKGSPDIKKNTLTNTSSELDRIFFTGFINDWYFLFNPFFSENEVLSINGPKSIKKNIDSFKTLRLLNSKLIGSSFFNFDLSLKIVFYNEGYSDVFYKNYEC